MAVEKEDVAGIEVVQVVHQKWEALALFVLFSQVAWVVDEILELQSAQILPLVAVEQESHPVTLERV